MDSVLVTGATGFIGQRLVAKLLERGLRVIAATRRESKVRRLFGDRVEPLEWDPMEEALPGGDLRDVRFAINLMGENIGTKRWSWAQKKRIHDSRILGTRHLAEGLEACGARPDVFVSTSAIGYYPHNLDGILSEADPADTSSFLGALCDEWEREAVRAPCGRSVVVRTGVVLGEGGGALAKLGPVFRLGLGGRAGSGEQMVSWIHVDDLVAVYLYALDNPLEGAFNAVAPNPVDNLTFSRTLARVLHRPCLFPVPRAALKIAMGEMSTIVLDGQRIAPKKLLEAGFRFSFPTVAEALGDIYS